MTQEKQVGYSSISMCVANSYGNDDLIALALGRIDRLPHEVRQQGGGDGNWIPGDVPFAGNTPEEALGYAVLGMGSGYQGAVCVVLMSYRNNQPFFTSQNSDGTFSDTSSLWTLCGHDAQNPPCPEGFINVCMAQGNHNNLQIVCIDGEGMPHLFYQNASDGSLHYAGTLWGTSFEPIIALSMCRGHDDALELVMLGKYTGVPYSLTLSSAGSWTNQGTLWDRATGGDNKHSDGFKDLTMHQGNNDNLQVVLLGRSDGLPYQFWQKDSNGHWYWNDAMTNKSSKTYKAIASGYGRNLAMNYLSVVMLDADQGQVWELYQDPLTGSWTSYKSPVLDTNNHPGGFSKLAVTVAHYEQHLQVVLLAQDNHMLYDGFEHDPLSYRTWEWFGMLPTAPLVAKLYETPPLSVNALLGSVGVTPSINSGVGVCLSGGGSRAMTAGMGQLRGLQKLSVNGKSLLSQVQALSTVSGGSWLGMSYSYNANEAVSDSEFLGPYIEPSQMTTTQTGHLDTGTIGARCTNDFSMFDLGTEAAYLVGLQGAATHMIWQILIGLHILKPYKLFKPGSHGLPTLSLTYNEVSRQSIIDDNPAYADTSFIPLANDSSARIARAFPIGNMAMKVLVDGQFFIAPVQCTPVLTGIVGAPQGAVDANGKAVGRGGVTSFGFNSVPSERSEDDSCELYQIRPWSIADATGVSSAALAAGVWQYLGGLALTVSSPEELRARIEAVDTDGRLLERVRCCIPPHHLDQGERLTHRHYEVMFANLKAMSVESIAELIVPNYDYWPTSGEITFDPNMKVTDFADAGVLDNTGVASMLAYSDIDTLIAFINSADKMEQSEYGAVDQNNQPIANTNIKLSEQVPILFGYRPYNDDPSKGALGYVPFSVNPDQGPAYLSKVQVFDSSAFPALLQGLWNSTRNASETLGARPATFEQALTTVQNDWFGVEGGRHVTMLWCYLALANDWYSGLQPDVRAQCEAIKNFPLYDTFDTELTPQQVNLMSSLTAWAVADSTNASTYINLFNS